MRADAEDNLFRMGEDPIRDFLSEQPPMKAHLPMPNGRKLISRDRSTKAVLDAIITRVSPAASWTHRRDLQAVREHDFGNLLQDFRYAVEQQDRTMMDYCECELRLMFREGTTKSAAVARAPKE